MFLSYKGTTDSFLRLVITKTPPVVYRRMAKKDFAEELKKLQLSKAKKTTKIGFDPQLGTLMHGQIDYWLVLDKLLTSRIIKSGIIKNVFTNVWRTKLSFYVGNLGKNIYLQRDEEMVLRLDLWLSNNSLQALEVPNTNVKLSQLSFEKVAFWVHFMDISFGFQNRFNIFGQKIRRCIWVISWSRLQLR